MELRLTGTREECAKAEAAICGVFSGAVEKVSPYYPNRKPGEEGTGRVYITLRAEP